MSLIQVEGAKVEGVKGNPVFAVVHSNTPPRIPPADRDAGHGLSRFEQTPRLISGPGLSVGPEFFWNCRRCDVRMPKKAA